VRTGASEYEQPLVADLIRRAQAGDERAFETLYREHVGRVFALCLRLSGDARRAEELTQDVFIRTWEKLASFRGESAFSSWLHRLTVNVALSEHRGEARRTKRVEVMSELPEVAKRGPEPGLDMDLEQAIAKLPPGARRVFVLHDIEGYQHDEIAAQTGIAVGTSKAQLFRARRLLREALDR
jgi:RNA polymerase sigma-70 factor, ECF subfamily